MLESIWYRFPFISQEIPKVFFATFIPKRKIEKVKQLNFLDSDNFENVNLKKDFDIQPL